MKKFVLKSLPYIAIGLLYGIVGEYFLCQTNEITPIKEVIRVQQESDNEVYFKRKIIENPLSRYKYAVWMQKQPKVLILGQSVTWQFRDFMFEPYSEDFYNTSLMVRNVKDLNYVLDIIESNKVSKPELVVLGVDFSFMLQTTYLDEKEWIKNSDKDAAISAKAHLNAIQRIWLNPELREIPKMDAGFGKGGMTGLGYRKDGSYRHKPHIEMYLVDSVYRDGELTENLKNKEGYFVEPFAFDSNKAEQLLLALERFDKLDIELLIYIPAMSGAFFDEALKNEKYKFFWDKYMNVQTDLQGKGYNVIPFCTPSQIGLTDHYMVDASHPGEVLIATQLLNFVQSGKARGKVLNDLLFDEVNELLESKNTIPVSFMRDSLSQKLLRAYVGGNRNKEQINTEDKD